MRRVLIIYEIVGFETKIYDLVVIEANYEKILKCHSKYLDPELLYKVDPNCLWLHEFLDGMPVARTSDDPEPYFPEERPNAVVITGVMV